MLIHEHACVSIRKDMPLDRAALIGCAVTTGVGAVIHTSHVQAGHKNSGDHRLRQEVGLAATTGAAIAGAGRIIAVDTNPGKLEMAKTFGATDLVNAADGDFRPSRSSS